MLHQRSYRRVPVLLIVFDELPLSSLMNEAGAIDPMLFPLQIAIAVEERIIALTKSYEADGVKRFSALLPPMTWSRPWDELQIFVARHRNGDVGAAGGEHGLSRGRLSPSGQDH